MNLINIGELGVTGAILIVMWKLLEFSIGMLRNNKDAPSHLDCIKNINKKTNDIHQYTELNKEAMPNIRQAVSSGDFACAWRGRDEVRDFRESISALTSETKLLRQEISRTRNGGK